MVFPRVRINEPSQNQQNRKLNVLVKRLFGSALVLTLTFSALARADEDPRLALVERLYQAYAWETQSGASEGEAFINEKPNVLEKFLIKSLARLMFEDSECARRTVMICTVDFSPLWSSQDPEGAVYHVKEVDLANTVTVTITYAGHKPMVVFYDTTRTSEGWRIKDIRSTSWSLMKMLTTK